MTALEKIEAEEYKYNLYLMAHCECTVCGKPMQYSEAQLAHRIPKGHVKIYGAEVIHHRFNMAITCSDCNASVLLTPAAHPVEAANLIAKIKEELGHDKGDMV